MYSTISSFVVGCSTYHCIEDSTQCTLGLLQTFPIPSCHFERWSLDLIIALPLSHGFNAVLTCVDRLTKLCKLTPCLMGGS